MGARPRSRSSLRRFLTGFGPGGERAMTYREFVCDLAARDDGAFAEYVSGLRFPAHLREAYAFAAANPRAIMLMPRGHAKTTGAIHHLARRIGESAGRLKIGVVTATEIGALQRLSLIH